MADQDPDRKARDGHPVISGLVALVVVAVALGLVAGIVAVVFTNQADESADATDGPGSRQTLVVPRPGQDDDESSGAGLPSAPSRPTTTLDPESPTGSPTLEPGEIVLDAGSATVAPGQRIDLTGSYPGGDGATLQVQVFRDGSWSDFPVTVSVSGQVFATYVTTTQTGPTQFRLTDLAADTMSNAVDVQIG